MNFRFVTGGDPFWLWLKMIGFDANLHFAPRVHYALKSDRSDSSEPCPFGTEHCSLLGTMVLLHLLFPAVKYFRADAVL